MRRLAKLFAIPSQVIVLCRILAIEAHCVGMRTDSLDGMTLCLPKPNRTPEV